VNFHAGSGLCARSAFLLPPQPQDKALILCYEIGLGAVVCPHALDDCTWNTHSDLVGQRIGIDRGIPAERVGMEIHDS